MTGEDIVADGLLTVTEAAAFSGIKKTKLYEFMDGGRLAYAKIGTARRIPKRALVALLAQHLVTRGA